MSSNSTNRQALPTMAPNGGTYVFILMVAGAAFAKPPGGMPADKASLKDIAKKLMMKCHSNGYPVPKMMLLKSFFNSSDLPAGDRTADQSNTPLSTFLQILNFVAVDTSRNSVIQQTMDASEKMMWNCSNLPAIIKMMRSSSEPSVCYMKAFVAPLSWSALTARTEDSNFDSNDYDSLLWAAKPVLEDIPYARMKLPPKVEGKNMKKMMNMLWEVHESMTDDQRSEVLNWMKEQITQSQFNCTMRPPPEGKSASIDRCKQSLKWLDLEALTMMGPYLTLLSADDVDSSPKEKLCDFFRSAQFNSGMTRATKMKPSLGKKFMQRIQECFSEKQFPENVDKLGPLACYYDAPDLTPELSKNLLAQLENCDNPLTSKLKKRLVNSLMTNSNSTQALHDLGSSVTLLSPKQLLAIPEKNLKDVLKSLGPGIKWTRSQLHALVKKQLGDKKCAEVPGKELMELQSVAAGLPSCVLKNVKAQEILDDTEGLRNVSKKMRKGQLKAMLQGLRGKLSPSELVQRLPGPLLRSVSLTRLDEANITSLEEVENKTWSLTQAAYLAKKMRDLKQLKYRRLHSVLQGITCKMIDAVAGSSTLDMAQALTETPQWLSKVQAGCAARKLFMTLEKERSAYFQSITEKEMDMIPSSLLLYLPPSSVMDLPDSVCPFFIDKMETANLTLLPPLAPSRPALIQRALLCLAKGEDLTGLTAADVLRLGSLLCEMQPSKLRLMAPDVIKFSLQTMVSCQHIPQSHRTDLIQLVSEAFGSPSDWSPDTMESLGPLLLLDEKAISALPNKPWMKDALVFLRSRLSRTSDALKRKIFDLTTTASEEARKKRAATSGNKGEAAAPSESVIEELGMGNVYWRAAQLDMISNSTFLATVEILGAISGYSAEQLDVLRKKAVEAFGPVSQMTESVVVQLGCITQGFNSSDLEKLPISLDNLEGIAHCGWRDAQMESVWKSVAKYDNLTAQQLGAAELVTLNRFICGLNPNEISKLNVDAFKDAVGSMDGIQCSSKVEQELKNLAVSAFGNPSAWTEARVSDLGGIVAALSATEMASLDPAVFSFFSRSCVSRIPPENFAVLSVAQLEALGPDNAAMITSEQKAVLKDDQLSALEKASTGPLFQSKTSESGAPPLSMEGMDAFMKPLLFLLVGFLLL
ncbi:otoancorin [Leuresthes tenuis]|uniref:otoancorin n=1 Tax=Leuresthes tenuis TaxID=355514 RepID=UPI003B5147CA